MANGEWKTLKNGVHVFLKDGESLDEAIEKLNKGVDDNYGSGFDDDYEEEFGEEQGDDIDSKIKSIVNKMTKNGTKEANLNGESIAANSNGELTEDQVHKWFEDNDMLEDYEAFNDDSNMVDDIDYENITYPKGTSKEYTMVVNNKYQKSLPILEKAGIKLEDFGGKQSVEGGYEDNTKDIMDKYVFEPFRKKYPNGNNQVWEQEYQPLYDAIESVVDKNYNDWWIKNKK